MTPPIVSYTPVHKSIGIRFFLLILAVAVPLAGFDYYHASQEIERWTQEVAQDLRATNREVTNKTGDLIESAQDLLQSLAVIDAVKGGDSAACTKLLHDVGARYSKYTNFSVVNAQRFIFCSSGPLPKPVDVSESPNIIAAFATKKFAVSPFKFGVLTGKPILVFSEPLFDARAQVVGTVNNGLSLTWLNDYLASIVKYPEEKVVMFDGQGTVLASYPDALFTIGAAIENSNITSLAFSRQGMREGRFIDDAGHDALVVIDEIPRVPGGAYVASYMSLDVALGETVRNLYLRLIALALISITVLLVGWLGARVILLDPVDKLIRMSGRLEEGDLSARSGISHDQSEIGRLASAFDSMVEGLESRATALRESEANYRELVESEEQLIHRYLPDTTEVLVNESLARFFGGSSTDWIGRKWIDYISEGQRHQIQRLLKTCSPEDPVFIYEQMSRNAAGEERWLRWSNRAFFDEDGNIKYFQAVGMDLTERKFAESALERAMMDARAANKAKSDFMANMSHELRTPLNAIIGFSEMMSSEMMGELPDTYMEYAGFITSSGNHLLNIINDILDLSKIEAGMMELDECEFDLRNTVTDVLQMLNALAVKNANTIEVTCNAKAGIQLKGDRLRIKQVLVNVIGNALKFTHNGTVEIITQMEGQGLTVLVRDSGIGMSDRDIRVALSPFGQVDGNHLSKRFEGTGLGLPLAEQLMEMHHGSLDIQSEVGKGTTVTLRFPPERSLAPKG